MGCRCCKMIQSYIFDPEEAQSPGYIHEANSYKQHRQDSNKSQFKPSGEIQEHKNELQKDELKRTENKSQVNSTKAALWHHRGTAFQEDGPEKCAAKLNVAVNGGSSCTGAHPGPSPNAARGASAQGASKPAQSFDLEGGTHGELACEASDHFQDGNSHGAGKDTSFLGSAIQETQTNAMQLPEVDYPQNSSETRNCVEKDTLSDSDAQPDQNTRPSAKQEQDSYLTLPLHMKENSAEPLLTSSVSVSEDIPDGITAKALPKAAQAPTQPDHRDTHGETEEEDAEVAAALAALEAATAGEDLEDDDDEY
uniref:Uncharacterized protein n=1 Tax=Nothoprocta perdicaria TaxID=30464 RepID=A0A8C6ZSC9_NOTPE